MRASIGLVRLAVIAVALGVTPAHAQVAPQPSTNHSASAVKTMPPEGKYVPPRTPDGQPDISGLWVNFDDTTFEASGPGRRPSDINPPEHWADFDSPVSARRRSMVVDPPDGMVPILPAAEAKRDDNFAHVGQDWIYETPWVRCITRGVPGGMFPAQYNNGYTIHQSPGYVVISYEMIHDSRIIPLDGRPHLGSKIRAVERRLARTLGREHAGHRDDQLQRQGDDCHERRVGARARRGHERSDARRPSASRRSTRTR